MAMIRLRAGVSFALVRRTAVRVRFTGRQIENEPTGGLSYARVRRQPVKHNEPIRPIDQSWQRTNNRPTADKLNLYRLVM
jgi:hypothetical protein